MTTALVFLTETAENLGKAQRELLSLGARFEQTLVAVPGDASESLRAELGRYGVATVYTAAVDPEIFAQPLVELLDAAIAAGQPELVLTGNDPLSREAAARVAVRREAGIVTDATDVSADLLISKDELAGSYGAQVKVASQPALVALKPNSVDDAPAEAASTPEVVSLPLAEVDAPQVRVLGAEPKPVSTRPALNEARVVVAGGRGVNGDFSPVEDLADALGAAVGASRAATDAGWISHDAQVGQTGVTVSPQLYISAGISGAIQQKAGMQTSKVIVAVNKDADAPVFEIADLGIVGDLAKVLPQAAEEIRRRQA
ncbi:electron transfer flavoprotein subunit alpha/FixB family protein [Glutamicibacter endophyticus]|uniref:electron transfer flavoprotein subunit alpha/FixB family protein n=1 Tax=Glutamicibacter sp. PS TaxID=3075634 RepID=UPI002848BF99|nr:electron transfer flavoprotein subunit alpha/FixB family protein [Glutamicibacter sp. PS]MDR4532368.1 electron transfer flavoprotein subunit alpha/FixB family protein [Glutamicibacter sp. PS]